jgi:hypothetical protein
MRTFLWFIFGGFVASLCWGVVASMLLYVIGGLKEDLAKSQVTLRLYRETRGDSDAQIRDLLDQNTRLARQLIDAKADAPPRSTAPVSTWPVMARES